MAGRTGVLGVVVVGVTVAEDATAADFTVGVSAGCATITACIATAGPGDNVLLPPGSYNEAITIANENVNLRRGAVSGLVTITAPAGGTILTASNTTLGLYDLTFDGQNSRRAIYMANGSLRMERVAVGRGFTSGGGGGVYSVGAAVTVVDSTFSGNVSNGNNGGGLYAYTGSLVMSGTTFSSNATGSNWGGGALVQSTSSSSVTGCTFTSNTAGLSGGGLAYYQAGGTNTVSNSTFTTNASTGGAGNGGGGLVAFQTILAVSGSTFTSNTATTGGGGAFLWSSSATSVLDSTFTGNSSLRGAGLYTRDNGATAVYRNTFCQNTSRTGTLADGAGYLHANAPATIANNVFFGNIGEDYGGGLGVAESGSVTVRNNDFVYNATGATGGRGSGAHMEGAAVTFTNNAWVFNTAQPAVQRSSGTGTLAYSAFFGNAVGDVSGTFVVNGPPHVTADPKFASFSKTDCAPYHLYPLLGSPLINAGTGVDPDGSTADIGAFGGPDADPALWKDADGDGAVVLWDCDDTDPARSQQKAEVCDALDKDEDCDGVAEDADTSVTGQQLLYEDLDQDGHGTGGALFVCPSPKLAGTNDDCDDSDPLQYKILTFYRDTDKDGHGDVTKWTQGCTAPTGYVALSDDCDDADGAVAALTLVYADNDNDGWGGTTSKSVCHIPPGWVAKAGDCDDSNGTINPGQSWYVDNDGDGVGGSGTVQGCPQPAKTSATTGDCNDNDAKIGASIPWYTDADGDGYGGGSLNSGCPPASKWSSKGGDCDDKDATINPATTWYGDKDGDGYGLSTDVLVTCAPGPGYARQGGDCAGNDAKVNPGAKEVCNTLDDDCDTKVDDADSSVDLNTGKLFYADADGDKHGDSKAVGVRACAAPAGTSGLSDDCNDADASIYTNATEQCNGKDDDCDGKIDDNVVSVDWYADTDGDGYGSGAATNACKSPGSGYVTQSGDCKASDPSIYPGAIEQCNGADDDCDGKTDTNAVDGDTFYVDDDGDGYGDPNSTVVACKQPADATTDDSDCDDTRGTVNPDGVEVCNGRDDDCSGEIDDDASDMTTYYADADGDGFGGTSTQDACDPPDDDWVTDGGDCADDDDERFPGADEACNTLDDDCDGDVDDGCVPDDTGSEPDSDAPQQDRPLDSDLAEDTAAGVAGDACGCRAMPHGKGASGVAAGGVFALLGLLARRRRAT